MVRTKGVSATTKNYEGAIGNVPAKYKTGVESAESWQSNAVAAEDLWKAKIAEAAANNARSKGISRVSDSEWKQAASNKGSSRIGQGMRESLPKYQRVMGEVLNVIENTSISARTADPMANVDNRVKPIVKNLADWKKSR